MYFVIIYNKVLSIQFLCSNSNTNKLVNDNYYSLSFDVGDARYNNFFVIKLLLLHCIMYEILVAFVNLLSK